MTCHNEEELCRRSLLAQCSLLPNVLWMPKHPISGCRSIRSLDAEASDLWTPTQGIHKNYGYSTDNRRLGMRSTHASAAALLRKDTFLERAPSRTSRGALAVITGGCHCEPSVLCRVKQSPPPSCQARVFRAGSHAQGMIKLQLHCGIILM